MRLSGPRFRPTTQKICERRESNSDLWNGSQKLWPLDHRGGPPCSSVNMYNRFEVTCCLHLQGTWTEILILSTKLDIVASQEDFELKVMNLWIPQEAGVSSQYELLLSPEEGLCSSEPRGHVDVYVPSCCHYHYCVSYFCSHGTAECTQRRVPV
jgi:hypothetical protein